MRPGLATIGSVAAFTLYGCVAYDPVLAELQSQGDQSGLVATPCEVPALARIRVEEYAFIVECGCLEPPGDSSRQCTIGAGSQVDWVFAGSVTHNVTANDDDFVSSPDRRRGQYPVRFDRPGAFTYGCSLHAGTMSDYRIVVLATDD
jgi:hypothetical protein